MSKVIAKRCLSNLVGVVGRQVSPFQQWLIEQVCPRLLDERALPNRLTPRRLRGLNQRVLCNPYKFIHRRPYWFGRLHEIHIDNFLRRTLARGDTFIDVGANYGQLSVLAAALVGPEGRVLAFEPNREWAQLVAEFARQEKLDQLTVHPFGLGEAPTTTRIHGSTLADSMKRENEDRSQFSECEIRVGDEVISPGLLRGKVLLKVDVEGFELQVLRGMRQMLKAVNRAVIEVTPKWIGGTEGVREMFAMMADAGLRPFHLLESGVAGAPLSPDEIHEQVDALFVRP